MNSHRPNHPGILLRSIVVLTLLLGAGCSQTPDPGAIPRMDRADLITEADLAVRCSDTSALAAALESSPLGRLWNSPAVTDARDGQSLEALFKQTLSDPAEGANAEQIGDIYMAQAKMLQGEVILGFDFAEQGADPAITIVAGISEADFNRSLEMDELLFELEQKDTVSASEDFQGTRIYTYIEKEEDGDRFYYQAFYQGTLLTTEDRTWLENALLRLMETPAREPQGDPVVTVHGKAHLLDRLMDHFSAQAAEKEAPFDLRTLLSSLGLDTLGDMRLALQMKPDRTDITLAVDRRGEWNRGLMAMIPPDPVPADFRLSYVPPDVASYKVTRFDLNALWVQIPEILRQISPESQMQFSMGVNSLGGMLDINVNEDIFNNLDRLAFSYARFGDHGQEFIYGLTVRDAGVMERTLRKVFSESSPMAAQMRPFYRETDIQGQTVHLLQIPMPENDAGTQVEREIGLAVVDRALVIGEGRLLENYVQAAVHNEGTPAFYAGQPYRTMAARIPAGACSYALSDMSAFVRYLAEEIRTAAARAEAAAQPAHAEKDCGCEKQRPSPLAALAEKLDIEKLPPTEELAAYFGISDGYSIVDADGLRSEITIHYPE
jgi:hypothetical protein